LIEGGDLVNLSGYQHRGSKRRYPIKFSELRTQRNKNKWDKIIDTFMEGSIDELQQIYRNGTRGRIFEILVKQSLDHLGIKYEAEPVFEHIEPDPWYVDLSSQHEDLKLRTHDFYNPDYFLPDGSWLEVTLSENTAYKKLFRYGHQAPFLKVVWIDEDTGLHKEIAQGIEFPNATVQYIQDWFPELLSLSSGQKIVDRFLELKKLKDIIG
jgi:hypothetical protein